MRNTSSSRIFQLLFGILLISICIPVTIRFREVAIPLSNLYFFLLLAVTPILNLHYSKSLSLRLPTFFEVVCLSYFLIRVFIGITSHGSYGFQTIMDSIPILILFFLSKVLKHMDHTVFIRFLKIFFWINVITIPLMLFIWIIGFNEFYFSATRIIQLVRKGTPPYGDSFSWWWGHKAKIGPQMLIIAYLAFYFIKNTKLLVPLFLSLMVICLISNSMTSLGCLMFFLFYKLYDRIKAKITLQFKLIVIPLLLLISVIGGIIFFNQLQKDRQVYSLGGRVYLWALALGDLVESPYTGHAKIEAHISEQEWLKINTAVDLVGKLGEKKAKYLKMGGSHNTFIQESRYAGIFCGILSLYLFILTIRKAPKNAKLMLSLILVVFMIDTLLTPRFINFFYFFAAVIIQKSKWNIIHGNSDQLDTATT